MFDRIKGFLTGNTRKNNSTRILSSNRSKRETITPQQEPKVYLTDDELIAALEQLESEQGLEYNLEKTKEIIKTMKEAQSLESEQVDAKWESVLADYELIKRALNRGLPSTRNTRTTRPPSDPRTRRPPRPTPEPRPPRSHRDPRTRDPRSSSKRREDIIQVMGGTRKRRKHKKNKQKYKI